MGYGRVGCKDGCAGDIGDIAKRPDTAGGRPNPTFGARNLSIRCVPALADTPVSAAHGALRAEQIARVVAVSSFVRRSKDRQPRRVLRTARAAARWALTCARLTTLSRIRRSGL